MWKDIHQEGLFEKVKTIDFQTGKWKLSWTDAQLPTLLHSSHQASHTGERPSECEEQACGKTFELLGAAHFGGPTEFGNIPHDPTQLQQPYNVHPWSSEHNLYNPLLSQADSPNAPQNKQIPKARGRPVPGMGFPASASAHASFSNAHLEAISSSSFHNTTSRPVMPSIPFDNMQSGTWAGTTLGNDMQSRAPGTFYQGERQRSTQQALDSDVRYARHVPKPSQAVGPQAAAKHPTLSSLAGQQNFPRLPGTDSGPLQKAPPAPSMQRGQPSGSSTSSPLARPRVGGNAAAVSGGAAANLTRFLHSTRTSAQQATPSNSINMQAGPQAVTPVSRSAYDQHSLPVAPSRQRSPDDPVRTSLRGAVSRNMQNHQ